MTAQRQALACGIGCRGCRQSTPVASPALARTLNGFAGLLFAVPLVAVAVLASLLREAGPLVQGGSLLAVGTLWAVLLRTQRQFFQRRLAAVAASEPMALATVINPDDYSDGNFAPQNLSVGRSEE